MPIRAVILDFYGTLAESTGAGLAWADLFSEIGHTLSQEAIDRLWNQGNDGVEHLEHSQSRDHYVAWQQARLRQIIEESGVPEGDDDLLFARMTELLGTQDLAAYPESREILAELRDRGLTLAICSNWNWDLLEAIENAGLTDTVDIVESSAWVGARKPHPRIYAHMLSEAEVRGDLQPGMTIVECTTGNAGIACAAVAAIKGYACVIVMPEGMSDDTGVTCRRGLTALWRPPRASRQRSRSTIS
jgi:putative hydrolase of the HAD superfamily